MLKPDFFTLEARPLRLRRAAAGASLVSALLVTCWSAGVGAGQATPTAPKTKSAIPSPTSGKTRTLPASSASADTVPRGRLDLHEFEAFNDKGIAIGHKFVYTTADRETVISGENGRYDKNSDTMDADTNLVLDNSKHHITGDKSHADLGKSRLVVNGNVVLTVKPEPTAANADPNASVDESKKQGAVVTCDNIESFYKKKFNILRGHLIMKQHIIRVGKEPLDRTATAEHAEYDGKKEILVLFPPVHYEDSDNQNFDSDKNPVTIYTKAGQETIKGLLSILHIPVKESDNDEGDTSTSAPVNPAKPDTKPISTKNPDSTTPEPGKKEPGKPNSK